MTVCRRAAALVFAGAGMVITDSRITYAGPAHGLKASQGAQVLDLAGKFVMPDLFINLHGHPGNIKGLVQDAPITSGISHHSVDVEWWESMVEGEKPLFSKGFANLPSRPGLSVTLNEDVVKQHLAEPGYFEPTPQWDGERLNDRLWS